MIINPYLNDSQEHSEYRSISGSFVALKWVMALKDHLNQSFQKCLNHSLFVQV